LIEFPQELQSDIAEFNPTGGQHGCSLERASGCTIDILRGISFGESGRDQRASKMLDKAWFKTRGEKSWGFLTEKMSEAPAKRQSSIP
jgi:hypothetical protein